MKKIFQKSQKRLYERSFAHCNRQKNRKISQKSQKRLYEGSNYMKGNLCIPDSQQISSWRFNGIYPCSKIDDRVSPNRSLSGKEWAHNPTEHESETIGHSKRGINIREWWSEPWAEVDFCCSPTPLGYSLRGKYWRHIENDIFKKSFSPTSIWIYFQKYLLWGCAIWL